MTITEFQNENRFLSNFYASPFYAEGQLYKTVEHFFQAAKTLDHWQKAEILSASTPFEAKKLGSKVDMREDWDLTKDNVMRFAVLNKFLQNNEIFFRLVDSGDVELIEGNHWHDNYWGQCSCKSCQGKGLNKLGLILMDVRDIIGGLL